MAHLSHFCLKFCLQNAIVTLLPKVISQESFPLWGYFNPVLIKPSGELSRFYDRFFLKSVADVLNTTIKKGLKKYANRVIYWLYFTIHEIIKWTRVTCKIIHCYMRELSCRWRNVKNFKFFWIYVKRIWILPPVRNCSLDCSFQIRKSWKPQKIILKVGNLSK